MQNRSAFVVLALTGLLLAPLGAAGFDVEKLDEKPALAALPAAPSRAASGALDTGQGCNLGTGTTALADGVTQTATLDNSVGANCQFSFAPNTAFTTARFTLPATTPADFDLYVRKGTPPTTTTYDCRPFLGGSSLEQCDIAITDATVIYANVTRFSGNGSFNLTATSFTPPPPPPSCFNLGTIALSDNVAVTYSANSTTLPCNFSFVPNPTFSIARFLMPATTPADFDLYVKKGSAPNTTSYDCRPFLGGSSAEQCDIPLTDATTIFASVRFFSGTGTFTLTARSLDPPPTCSLGNGVTALTESVATVANLTADVGANCKFSYVPNTAFDSTRVTVAPPAGSSFNVYLKKGSMPTTSVYDCLATGAAGAARNCTVSVLDATPIYAMVLRSSGSGQFSITPSSFNTCSLGPGVHLLANAAPTTAALTGDVGAACYFALDSLATADIMDFLLPATTPADFDLYVKAGAIPTTTIYDCRPYLGGGSDEDCQTLIPEGAPVTTYFAMVRRFSGSGSFSLTGSAVVLPELSNGNVLPGNVLTGKMNLYKVIVPEGGSQMAVTLVGVGRGCAEPAAVCAALANPATALAGAPVPVCATAPPEACAALTTVGATATKRVNSDADLYVRKASSGGLPTTSLYDCRGFGYGTNEVCAFSNELSGLGPIPPPPAPALPEGATLLHAKTFLGPGKYFVGVRGFVGPEDYAITAVTA
jgi:large repetitive protein